MIKRLFILIILPFIQCSTPEETEVLVIGGSASGIAAAISSARLQVSTILIEQGPWLGGMLTAAGVSATDGNYKLPSGFWGEFRDSLVAHYGSEEKLQTGWVSKTLFEPSVGNEIFQQLAKKEKITVFIFPYQLVITSSHSKRMDRKSQDRTRREADKSQNSHRCNRIRRCSEAGRDRI